MERTTLAALAKEKGVEMHIILNADREEFRRLSKVEWNTDVSLHAKIVGERRRLRNERFADVRIKSLQTLYNVADTTREEVLSMSSEDFYDLCMNVLDMTETQQAMLVVDRMALLEASVNPMNRTQAQTAASPDISSKRASVPVKTTLCGPVPENLTSLSSDAPSSAKRKANFAQSKKLAATKAKRIKTEGQQGSARERICRAMLTLRALKINEPPRIYVALFSGYSNITSTGFAKALSELKQEDVIEYPGKSKTIRLTESGARSLPPVDPPKDTSEVHERLLAIVKKIKGTPPEKADRIFGVLSDGQVHTRKDLATAAGYTNITSTGFTAVLSSLANLGLTEIPARGSLQLTDIAFPFGREPQPPTMTSQIHGRTTDSASINSSTALSLPENFASHSSEIRPAPKRKIGSSENEPAPTPKKRKSKKQKLPLSGQMSKASVHERICRAMVEFLALRMNEPPRSYVALLAGYTNVRSPGFVKALSAVKTAGIVEYPTGDTMKLTELGINTLSVGFPGLNINPLPHHQPPKDNAEMQTRLLAIVRNAQGLSPDKTARVFHVLKDGRSHKRVDVGAAVGYTNVRSPGFCKVLSSMSSLGLIQYPDKASVQLADIAFPYGRDALVSSTAEAVDSSSDLSMTSTGASIPAPSATTISVPVNASSRSSQKKKLMRTPKKRKTAKAKQRPANVREAICNILMEMNALNIAEAQCSDLAEAVGYSNKNSAGFANTLKTLKEEGIIEYTNKVVQLTDHGIGVLPHVDKPKDNAEMQDRLIKILKTIGSSPKMEQIFNELKDGHVHNRKELAATVGYTNVNSAGFGTAIAKMDSLGLIQKPEKGYFQFTTKVFPFGRDTQLGTSIVQATLPVAPPAPDGDAAGGAASAPTVPNTSQLIERKKPMHKKKPKKAKARQQPGNVRERICAVLVELHALGIKEAPRLYVAESAGYSNVNSTGFGKMLSALKKDGIVECKKGTVNLTEHGVSALPHVDPPKDNTEMQARLLKMLKTVGSAPIKMEQIFDKLKDGKAHKRDELAASVGYTNVNSTGFSKVLAKMNTLGLIQKPGKGLIQFTDDRVFPFGRDEEDEDESGTVVTADESNVKVKASTT